MYPSFRVPTLNQPINVILVANSTRGSPSSTTPITLVGPSSVQEQTRSDASLGQALYPSLSLLTLEQRYSPSRKSSPPLRTSTLASLLTTCLPSPPRMTPQASSTSMLSRASSPLLSFAMRSSQLTSSPPLPLSHPHGQGGLRRVHKHPQQRQGFQ